VTLKEIVDYVGDSRGRDGEYLDIPLRKLIAELEEVTHSHG
jgi:hypothetical protein